MRVLVLVNTLAGSGDAGVYQFVRALGEDGAEVTMRFFRGTGAMADLVADGHAFDRVVAAGGDGTVSAVCYALRGTGVPVLAFPAGTGNLLALNLHMPLDPRQLAETTLRGAQVAFDLGELHHPADGDDEERTGFAIVAGAGFDAAIMQAAQPLKATLGPAAYLVAAMGNLAPTTSRFELVLDGEHVSTDGIAVLIVNFGRLQFDLPVTHNSDPRDGVFEIAVLRTRFVPGLIPAVAAALLDRVGDFPDRTKGIDVYTAQRIEVSAYPPLRMQFDGEVAETLTPFSARVLPGAATLLVPADSPFAPQDEIEEAQ